MVSCYLHADIDDCNSGYIECDRLAVCVNTPGSYQCTCRPGYEGDGKKCQGKKSFYWKNLHSNYYTIVNVFKCFFKNTIFCLFLCQISLKISSFFSLTS